MQVDVLAKALRLVILRRALQMAAFVSRDEPDIPKTLLRASIKLQAVHAQGVCTELEKGIIILTSLEELSDFHDHNVQQELAQVLFPATLDDLNVAIEACQTAVQANIDTETAEGLLRIAAADITREDLESPDLLRRLTGEIAPDGCDAPEVPISAEIMCHVDIQHSQKYDRLDALNPLQEQCARLLTAI